MNHQLPLKRAHKPLNFKCCKCKVIKEFYSKDNEPKQKMVLADWKWWHIADYYSVK